MSQVVVDASLAIKWVLDETDSDVARALLQEWATDGVHPNAPGWFACEMANALFQRVRGGRLTVFDAVFGLRAVVGRVRLLEIEEPALASRALVVANALGQRAAYDAQYVALAERLGCELWTADARFGRAAQPAFPFVHWLGETSATTT